MTYWGKVLFAAFTTFLGKFSNILSGGVCPPQIILLKYLLVALGKTLAKMMCIQVNYLYCMYTILNLDMPLHPFFGNAKISCHLPVLPWRGIELDHLWSCVAFILNWGDLSLELSWDGTDVTPVLKPMIPPRPTPTFSSDRVSCITSVAAILMSTISHDWQSSSCWIGFPSGHLGGAAVCCLAGKVTGERVVGIVNSGLGYFVFCIVHNWQ